MASNSRSNPIVYVVIGVALVVVAVFGLRPTREVREEGSGDFSADLSHTSALITARIEMGGMSVFGWVIREPSRTVTVGFLGPAGCSDVLAYGDAWPSPLPACASPIDVAGLVSGLGITVDGSSIVGIDVAVDEACYDAAVPGEPWQGETGPCAPAG